MIFPVIDCWISCISIRAKSGSLIETATPRRLSSSMFSVSSRTPSLSISTRFRLESSASDIVPQPALAMTMSLVVKMVPRQLSIWISLRSADLPQVMKMLGPYCSLMAAMRSVLKRRQMKTICFLGTGSLGAGSIRSYSIRRSSLA